jgi:hypothetical protein
MVTTLAYLPFRVVYAPTRWVGRVVAWLAEGYREGTPVEQVLIFPSWAILRGLFIVGWALSQLLHGVARRSLERLDLA